MEVPNFMIWFLLGILFTKVFEKYRQEMLKAVKQHAIKMRERYL